MKIVMWFSLLAILAASCGSPKFIQHTPTLVNDGTHTDKNQLKAVAQYSTGGSASNNFANVYDRVQGIQLQNSFSIAKNWSVQGSFMHSAENSGKTDENGMSQEIYRYRRNIVEVGGAYFSHIGSNVYYSLGIGTGFGGYRSIENLQTDTRLYNSDIFKLYFQPILYWAKPRTSFSFGTKFSRLTFNNIESDYTQEERTRRNLSLASKHQSSTMDIFLRFEWMFGKNIPLGMVVQMQSCTDISGNLTNQYNNSNYGIGLVFKTGKWFR